MTTESRLKICFFQHLPASIFILIVSSESPKGPHAHFLLIFVKKKERSIYSKHGQDAGGSLAVWTFAFVS